MQNTSSADKGFKTASIFLSFSMFPMVIDPLKYCWVIILPGLAMVYFSFRKYREEKNTGLEHSKYRLITTMLSLSVLVLIAASIANFFDLYGYI